LFHLCLLAIFSLVPYKKRANSMFVEVLLLNL
jgi:hypothetical protein